MVKLIIIEGIPGSGKSSAANFVERYLSSIGHQTALFMEGDLDHPADFESVAYLTDKEYDRLKTQFPHQADFLDMHVKNGHGEYCFEYRKLARQYKGNIPIEVFEAMSGYDVYQLPVDKYRSLIEQRWSEFTERAGNNNDIYIFECAFLQNILTMLLGANKETIESAKVFVLKIADIIKKLDPRLIYLHPGDVEGTLKRVAKNRPPEWLDFVIAYHTEQGYGKAQGWEGFDGMVRFYQMRQHVELELLDEMPFPSLTIHHTDWGEDYQKIELFLKDN